MSEQSKPVQPLFILACSSSQYTDARRKLELSPREALWLTRPSDLKGKHRPKIFRYGDWKALARIKEIEVAITETEAEITDLS